VTRLARPHDRFFKALMGHKDAAEALFRERLPAELVALLASGPPEPADPAFVDGRLRESASDRLFRLRLREDTTLIVSCLVEHKSTPEPRVALQVLRYMVCIWEREDRDLGGKGLLSPITPLLVYHGAEPWNVPCSFLKLVKLDRPLGAKALDFEMIVVDLGQIDDATLSHNPTLRAGLLELKYATRPAMQRLMLGAILEALKLAPEFLPTGLVYIMETYSSIDRAFLLGEVRRVMPEHEETVMSIAAQEWKAEWKAEGQAEGRAEGRAEALLSILERRFGPLPEGARVRVAAATASEVDVWLDRVIDSPTLDAVIGATH
jgi:predicted transposase YdaD